jgi:Family of unknown function (DUF5357)
MPFAPTCPIPTLYLLAMVKQFFASFWDFIRPKQHHSWQAALWLALLGCLFTSITASPVHEILARLSWVSFIVAVGWLTTLESPIVVWGLSLGPWITGMLVCLFLFSTGGQTTVPREAALSWPLVAAAIAVLPNAFDLETGRWSPPSKKDRQRLIILVMSNLLLVCWILFYYRIQDWLVVYPGLQGERFEDSSFVLQRALSDRNFDRGYAVVDTMESQLRRNTTSRPRKDAELWLYNIQKDPQSFRDSVLKELGQTEAAKVGGSRAKDEAYWGLEATIGEPSYQVTLGARWQGPSHSRVGYIVQKACQVSFGGDDRGRVGCNNSEVRESQSTLQVQRPDRSRLAEQTPIVAPDLS